MVSLGCCIDNGCKILQGKAENARFEAEILLGHLIQKDRLYIAVHKDCEVPCSTADRFYDMCRRRASGEPSAYITGVKEFMSLEFEVNKNVLIPRPETEMLVEMVCEKYQSKDINIIDICTGSGAIACSVAHFLPKAKVTATDISDAALEVALKNAQKNKVDNRVHFVKSDALKKICIPARFDLVLSNPPYIESSVIDTLETCVKDYEPRLALDGGNDGLIFYTKIVDNIKSILNPGGELMFEIGCNQGKAVSDIMSTAFTDIRIIKDLAGLDRVVCGQLA